MTAFKTIEKDKASSMSNEFPRSNVQGHAPVSGGAVTKPGSDPNNPSQSEPTTGDGLCAPSCSAPIFPVDSTGYDDLPNTLQYLSAENPNSKYYAVIDKTTGKIAKDLGHPVFVDTKAGFYIDMDLERNSKIGFNKNLEIKKTSREK